MTSKWEAMRLGELADFQNGYPFKPAELGDEGLPVIRIKQLMDKKAEADRTQVEVPIRFHIGNGDIIFSWSGRIEAVRWERGRAVLNQHLYRVSVTDSRISDAFLLLSLQHLIPKLHLHGSTMKHVTKRELVKAEILVPPLADQRRIVDLIGALDDAIEAAEEQVESTINLGDGLAGSAFESAVGDPDIQTLKQVVGEKGLIQTGPFGSQLHKHDYQDHGIPVVMPTNIIDSRVNVQGIARISHEMAETLNKHLLKPGDIVWSRRGDVTRFAQVTEEDEDMICGTGCLLVRPESAEIASWLTVWFSSKNMQNLIQDRAVGATMKNLNTKILGDLPVVLPTNGNELAGALRAVGENMIFYKNHVQSLRSLRAELLTALLSGTHEIPESYDSVMELAGA